MIFKIEIFGAKALFSLSDRINDLRVITEDYSVIRFVRIPKLDYNSSIDII